MPDETEDLKNELREAGAVKLGKVVERGACRCPLCEYEATSLLGMDWGTGGTMGRVNPYICGGCVSLLLIVVEPDLAGDGRSKLVKLVVPDERMLAHLRSNSGLWDHITRMQKQMRRVPNRRTPKQ